MTEDTILPPASANSWSDLRAPDLAVFEKLAHEAFAAIPEDFRSLCQDVALAVEDFPTDDMLTSVGAEGSFDLLGLFEGIGLSEGGDPLANAAMPNRIWLFRRPILDYWAEFDEALGDVIRHVLIHEIGHHFGLSDDDMERIEAAVP